MTDDIPRRPRSPRGHGFELRGVFIDAAERIIATGEGDLTVRGIVKAVGVSPPSFYLHFVSLDQLILEVYMRHRCEIPSTADRAVAVVALQALAASPGWQRKLKR